MNRRTILALPLCAVVKSEPPFQVGLARYIQAIEESIARMEEASAEYQRRMAGLIESQDGTAELLTKMREDSERVCGEMSRLVDVFNQGVAEGALQRQ